MNWLYLLVAGVFEILFALTFGGLKGQKGFSMVVSVIVVFVFMAASLSFLYLATKKIPIGTAYAVWTGIGAGGTAIAAVLLYNEPVHGWRMFFLLLLLVSVIGLKLTHANS